MQAQDEDSAILITDHSMSENTKWERLTEMLL